MITTIHKEPFAIAHTILVVRSTQTSVLPQLTHLVISTHVLKVPSSSLTPSRRGLGQGYSLISVGTRYHQV